MAVVIGRSGSVAPVGDDEKDDGVFVRRVPDRMWDVGRVVGGVAAIQRGMFAVAGDLHRPPLDGDELARAFEMRAARQAPAGAERDLVVLDALLQPQRGE